MSLSPTDLSSESRPTPCGDAEVSSRDLGDELLIYDRGSDQVHMLNGSARELFLLCDGKRTLAEILQAFAERYEIDRETSDQAAREALIELAGLGVLEFS